MNDITTSGKPETNVAKKLHKEAARQQRIKIVNISSIFVLLIAIFWGIAVFFHFNDSAYTDDAQVDAYINPVNVRIQGFIKDIRFKEHQRVHKGDTLAIIEDSEYRLRVDEARAAVADAQASRSMILASVKLADNNIEVSDAKVLELKARLKNLEANYKRYEHLLAADVVTQYQFDMIKTDLEATRAQLMALQSQSAGSTLSSEEAAKRLPVNEASLRKAEDALHLAELNLSYTTIIAPYDGVLGRKTIELGQLMQAGQIMVSILRDDDKWITANYTESQMKHISIGKKLKVEIDALPGKTFTGTVTAISEATGSRYSAVPVDNSTGNFVKIQQRIPVRIDLDKNNNQTALGQLRAGMNAVLKNI